jgi:uncharacterized protein YcfL
MKLVILITVISLALVACKAKQETKETTTPAQAQTSSVNK